MKTYTIKEMSEMFELAPSTLRYYEEMGILTDVGRTPSKQRIYYEKHVNRMKSVCCFKGTGMKISALQALFKYEENEAENIDSILSLLNDQKEQVTIQIEQMQQDLAHVNRKLRYYQAIKTALDHNEALPDWNDFKK